MGAGASSTSSPAVVAACSALVKVLRAEYEALVAADTDPENIVVFVKGCNTRLQQCAQKARDEENKVAKLAAIPPAPAASGSDSPKTPHNPTAAIRGLQKGNLRGPGNLRAKRGGGNRRRSFGVADMKKFSSSPDKPTVGSAPAINASASEPALSAVEMAAAKALNDASAQLDAMKAINAEVASSGAAGQGSTTEVTDHWDSVSQMPYCEDCQMAFKTLSALDRHVKYSNLHETTMAKKKALEEEPSKKETAKAALIARQEEGKDFRLMYYGSKFFWRTQDNIDMSFYQHILLHVIEVVPFDVYKNKEMERIYLNKFIVEALLHDDCKAATDKKKKDLEAEAAKSKFTVNVKFDWDAEFHATMRLMITTYILGRLQLHESTDKESNKHANRCSFHTLNTDNQNPAKNPEIHELPEMLVPVSVTHRRNTSTEAINKKMAELNDNKASLKSAMSKAEKVSGVVHQFIKATSLANARLAKMPIGLKRFIMAVKRVIQINGVERTKKHLARLDAASMKKVQLPGPMGSSPLTKSRRSRKSIREV